MLHKFFGCWPLGRADRHHCHSPEKRHEYFLPSLVQTWQKFFRLEGWTANWLGVFNSALVVKHALNGSITSLQQRLGERAEKGRRSRPDVP